MFMEHATDEERMGHDEAKAFIRWAMYEFSTCLATEEEEERLKDAMRTLELSDYDYETKRFA